MIYFSIPIKPKPKGRPRFNGHHAYTDAETRNYEAEVKFLALKYKPKELLNEPIHVSLIFGLKKPSKTIHKLYPAGRPDIDNLQKAVLDSLNGLFWKDDSQIVELRSKKTWVEEPYIVIRICTWSQAEMAWQ